MSVTKLQQEKLVKAALRARESAYAPYSKFRVGAAVMGKNGSIYLGGNLENASYGLTNCAERVAIAAAVTDGETAFVAMAIAIAGSGSPCGACRQVMAEFCDDLPIYLIDVKNHNALTVLSLKELLPNPFGTNDMN